MERSLRSVGCTFRYGLSHTMITIFDYLKEVFGAMPEITHVDEEKAHPTMPNTSA
jgi:hypothetical protein